MNAQARRTGPPARVYQLAERAREQTAKRQVEDHRPLPRFKLAPFTPCPACGAAAGDGMELRPAPWLSDEAWLKDKPGGAIDVARADAEGRGYYEPFRGIVCFWCGCCHNSDGRGGWALMMRRVKAIDPPKAARAPQDGEPWATVERLP